MLTISTIRLAHSCTHSSMACLLCCPSTMHGMLSQVLQLMRGRTNFLLSDPQGQESKTAKVRGGIISPKWSTTASEGRGQLGNQHGPSDQPRPRMLAWRLVVTCHMDINETRAAARPWTQTWPCVECSMEHHHSLGDRAGYPHSSKSLHFQFCPCSECTNVLLFFLSHLSTMYLLITVAATSPT